MRSFCYDWGDYHDLTLKLTSGPAMVIDAPECSDPRKKARAPGSQLPSLTSLRGLAALWVVLYHYSVQCFPSLDVTHFTHFISKGYLAVDMFFMLSGFVMTHVYYRVFANTESIKLHYRSFLVARVARLYPMHVFVLFLFVTTALTSQMMASSATGTFLGIPWNGPELITAAVANVLMLQGLDAGKLSWNYPAWSISVEFMAYLVFPLILPIIWRASNRGKLVLALILVIALLWLAFLTKDNFNQWDGPITLLRCMPEFLLGTLLYHAYRMNAQNTLINGDAVTLGIIVAVLLCLHFGAPDLLIVALFAALIPIAVANTGRLSEAANVRPLMWLGEISYSLYLIHGFVEFGTTKLLGAFGIQNGGAELSSGGSSVLMFAMVTLCLIFATATYSGVEVTWRRHLRNLLGVRQISQPVVLRGSPHA